MSVTPFDGPGNEGTNTATSIPLAAVNFPDVWRDAWTMLWTLFPYLLITQSFDIISEAILVGLEVMGLRSASTLSTILWSLPSFFLPWLSLCFTAAFLFEVQRAPQHPRTALEAATGRLWKATGKVALASLLAGLLIGLGLLVILPGLYFSWTLSFVPLWALLSPQVSAFDALPLSKRQARAFPLVSLLCVFGGMVILLGVRLLVDFRLKPLLPLPSQWLAAVILFVVSIPLGALTNLLLVQYFLKTWERVYEELRRKSEPRNPGTDRG